MGRCGEFEQVVGRGDQLPLGLAGSEAVAEEAVAPPDHLRVREDGFDDLLAATVERLSLWCRERGPDPFCFRALAGLRTCSARCIGGPGLARARRFTARAPR
jgi:hypothetical protein